MAYGDKKKKQYDDRKGKRLAAVMNQAAGQFDAEREAEAKKLARKQRKSKLIKQSAFFVCAFVFLVGLHYKAEITEVLVKVDDTLGLGMMAEMTGLSEFGEGGLFTEDGELAEVDGKGKKKMSSRAKAVQRTRAKIDEISEIAEKRNAIIDELQAASEAPPAGK